MPTDLLNKMYCVAFSDGMPPRAQVYVDMILETLGVTQEVKA